MSDHNSVVSGDGDGKIITSLYYDQDIDKPTQVQNEELKLKGINDLSVLSPKDIQIFGNVGSGHFQNVFFSKVEGTLIIWRKINADENPIQYHDDFPFYLKPQYRLKMTDEYIGYPYCICDNVTTEVFKDNLVSDMARLHLLGFSHMDIHEGNISGDGHLLDPGLICKHGAFNNLWNKKLSENNPISSVNHDLRCAEIILSWDRYTTMRFNQSWIIKQNVIDRKFDSSNIIERSEAIWIVLYALFLGVGIGINLASVVKSTPGVTNAGYVLLLLVIYPLFHSFIYFKTFYIKLDQRETFKKKWWKFSHWLWIILTTIIEASSIVFSTIFQGMFEVILSSTLTVTLIVLLLLIHGGMKKFE